MATYAKLSYNGKIQTVALFEGLNTEELTSLLKTVFSVEGNIVGLMAEVFFCSRLDSLQSIAYDAVDVVFLTERIGVAYFARQ